MISSLFDRRPARTVRPGAPTETTQSRLSPGLAPASARIHRGGGQCPPRHRRGAPRGWVV